MSEVLGAAATSNVAWPRGCLSLVPGLPEPCAAECSSLGWVWNLLRPRSTVGASFKSVTGQCEIERDEATSEYW